jgi:DNA polymerase IV
MSRAIIHLNVADFAVAVERGVDSRFRGRPVIIAPQGAVRATVYDMSDEAYQSGVRKGMPLQSARRLCRDAAILPPHPDRYERAMGALVKKALPYSPLIEPGEGDGHLFVDVTGTGRLFGPPMDVAWRLRRQMRSDLGLDPIWSVAPNKLVAKVATRLVKPTGEYIVSAGEEETLLAPLPLGLVPGVEHSDLMRLREFNFTRVHEVTALSLPQMEVPFGRRALFLYEAMRGIDPTPVLPVGNPPPRARAEHEFGDDTNDARILENRLYDLVEQVGRGLRRQRRVARRLRLVLDYSDGVRAVRQRSFTPATSNDLTLFEQARLVLEVAWTRRVRIRHMRLAADRLIFPPAQLSLFAAERRIDEQRHRLVAAMDQVRERFGPGSVRIGRTLAA